jgi:glutamine amidotransferase
MKTVIIDYGAGNVRSVSSALSFIGVDAILSNDPEVIQQSDFVIFPGVGHAKSAMDSLKEKQLHRLIPTLKQPVLGICLGMQLLCGHNEEGDIEGLGIFDVSVLKFTASPKVPHMGWNTIHDAQGFCTGFDQHFYFVHSYFVPVCSDTVAKCTYGHEFSAALQKNNFFATQFHPEKSSDAGLSLLTSFFKQQKITE